MIPAGYPQEMANELRRAVQELGFTCAHLACKEVQAGRPTLVSAVTQID
jgi:hypothetical protein